MPSAPHEPAATIRQRLPRRFWFDDSLPRPVRRANHLAMLAVLAAIPIMATMLVRDFTNTSAPLSSGWYILISITMLGAVFSCKRVARREVSRAAAHDHLLCPACTYDLRTLDANGICPECGRAYEHAGVRTQWLDAQRRLKRGSRERSP